MAAPAKPGPREAAATTISRHHTRVHAFGADMTLPGMDQLAFYAGLGALAALGIIEWPVAAVLVVGHALARSHHSRMLQEFGEALEAA